MIIFTFFINQALYCIFFKNSNSQIYRSQISSKNRILIIKLRDNINKNSIFYSNFSHLTIKRFEFDDRIKDFVRKFVIQ